MGGRLGRPFFQKCVLEHNALIYKKRQKVCDDNFLNKI